MLPIGNTPEKIFIPHKETAAIFIPCRMEVAAVFLILWTLVCFAHWSFSLIRKMEMGETIIHPLCGCASIVIQKNYLSVYNKVVQAIL